MASKLQMAEDLDHPPEVGRFYLVRCVLVRHYGCLSDSWIPILGSLHIDQELSDVAAKPHYHVFVPFLAHSIMRAFGAYGDSRYRQAVGAGAIYARAVHTEAEFVSTVNPRNPLGTNTFRPDSECTRRVKCKREWPAFPELFVAVTAPRLARHNCPLKPSMICPHRGMNLKLVKPDERGIITCPGHGLQWWVATGDPVIQEKGR